MKRIAKEKAESEVKSEKKLRRKRDQRPRWSHRKKAKKIRNRKSS